MNAVRLGPGAGLYLFAAACVVACEAPQRAAAQAADEKQARACFEAGQAAYVAGRLEEAQQGFECAFTQLPSAELAWNLARVAERKGDVERGVHYFREYLARAHVSSREQRAVEARIQKLYALEARQAQVLKADAEVQTAMSQDARNFFQRGVKLFRRNHFEAAAAAFAAALAASGAPELHYNLALCAERLGRTEDATDHYHAYLRALPEAADREQIAAHMSELAKR